MDATKPLNKPVLVESNGEMSVVLPKNGKYFELAELYEHLDCDTVQVVKTPSGVEMWMDENGKLNSLPINRIATFLWKVIWADMNVGNDDFMVGSVLYVPKEYQAQE